MTVAAPEVDVPRLNLAVALPLLVLTDPVTVPKLVVRLTIMPLGICPCEEVSPP